MDAIILAAAGLTRLGHADRINEIIPQSYCLPAVGQGALAIECRADNFKVRQMLDFLNDTATKQATDAERAFLGLLEGGCQVPIGVHAEVNEGRIAMEAVIASLDGSTVLRDTAEGNAADAVTLGRTLGQKMLDKRRQRNSCRYPVRRGIYDKTRKSISHRRRPRRPGSLIH